MNKKLSDEVLQGIVADFKGGMSQKAIADKYGINEGTVSRKLKPYKAQQADIEQQTEIISPVEVKSEYEPIRQQEKQTVTFRTSRENLRAWKVFVALNDMNMETFLTEAVNEYMENHTTAEMRNVLDIARKV